MADVLSATKQYKRLFKGTLDPSCSWETVEELRNYLLDPTCPKNAVVGAEGKAFIIYEKSENILDIMELGTVSDTQLGGQIQDLDNRKYDNVTLIEGTREDGTTYYALEFWANSSILKTVELDIPKLTQDQLDDIAKIDEIQNTANSSYDIAATTNQALLDYMESNNEELRQLKIVINELNYKEITTTKFNVYPANAELGSNIDVNVTWEYNKEPVSQSINGIDLEYTVREQQFTNLNKNTTFKLVFSDGRVNVTKSVSVSFLNSRGYGVSSSKTYDSDFIKSLTRTLTGSRACTFTVDSGINQYIYFAIPSRFGTPTFFVGGFEGGFSKVATIDYTNPSNYTEPYDIYRSDYHNLGNTTVTVK